MHEDYEMEDDYDFSDGVRIGDAFKEYFKDGKYWVRVHHPDHIELRQVEAATGQILSSAIMPKEAAKEMPEVLA
jgi:hypothetical protein